MFEDLPISTLKDLIKLYNLHTKIVLSKVVNGIRRAKTKLELVGEVNKHLEIKPDGEIVLKKGSLDVEYKPNPNKIPSKPKQPNQPKPKPQPKPQPKSKQPKSKQPKQQEPKPDDNKDKINYNKLDSNIIESIYEYMLPKLTKPDIISIFKGRDPKDETLSPEEISFFKNRDDEGMRKALENSIDLKTVMRILKKKFNALYTDVKKEIPKIIYNYENYKHPDIIKKPLKLERGFNFIDKLKLKGKDANLDYSAKGGLVSELITLLFYEKYGASYPFKFIDSDSTSFNRWDYKKFISSFKRCIITGDKLICIPLAIPGHMNLLIFKIDEREIMRFEPHGKAYGGKDKDTIEKEANQFCQKLVDDINNDLELNDKGKRPFKYLPPSDVCPLSKKGFQYMENRAGDDTGFCQMWSMFFMECILRNPELPIKEIYTKAYDKMNNDPKFFLAVIKGYFLQVDELLNDIGFYKKSITGKEISDITSNKFYDKYYKYLKKVNEDFEKRPKIEFTGKGAFRFPDVYKVKGNGAFNLPEVYKL